MMNLEHLQPVQYTYPQMLDNVFDCKSHALVCAFNRIGTLVAVGCLDGTLYIWDFVSKTISKSIQAHTSLIHALAWSKKSDMLLSCSSDCSICLWTTIDGQCRLRLIRFQTLAISVEFHPYNSNLILINLFRNYSFLFNRQKYSETTTKNDFYETFIDPSLYSSSPNDGWISTFNHDGTFILTGNAQGQLLIFSTVPTVKLFRCGRIGEHRTSAIRQICVSKRSKSVAILTMNKIHIYEWSDLIQQQQQQHKDEFQARQVLVDSIMKMRYMKINFSGDGEYICAASVRQNRLFIWEIFSGSLVKILEDERGKSSADITWHPWRPVIVSISDGLLYTWSRPEFEAFPSYFHEIDENILYHERENEFDDDNSEALLNVQPSRVRLSDETINDEPLIDILSVEPLSILCDDENDRSWEEDIVWVPTGTMSEDDEEVNIDNE